MKRHLRTTLSIGFFFIFFMGKAQEVTTATHTIYVSSISWHSGILVPAYALPDSLWEDNFYYADSIYLEIGWGDADFFPHDRFNIWYALKAVFWPTASVIHVNPIYQTVEDYYYNSDIVRIELDDEQLQQLSLYIINEFELDTNGKVIPDADGFYAESQFYKGRSSYYFPNNSNVWVARAIQRSGFPLRPIWYQTTGGVLNKMEDFGQRVERND